MKNVQEPAERVVANVERVIIGKHVEVRMALVALLCQGHILIEDVPGVGKTMLAKALCQSIGCSFRRIQFTPDLLPSDVTGLSIFNQKTHEFEFRPGPDHGPGGPGRRDQPRHAEDAVARCSSAWRSGRPRSTASTYPMPSPFLVIATQNPIEYEGTFALPEAQLDRFMLRLRLGYPKAMEEIVILDEQKRRHPIDDVTPGARPRGAARDAGRHQGGLRRPGRGRVHRPAGARHARAPRRLPRRLAARLAQPVPLDARPRRAGRAATT